VGDADFASSLASHSLGSYRVVHASDCVPHLPPCCGGLRKGERGREGGEKGLLEQDADVEGFRISFSTSLPTLLSSLQSNVTLSQIVLFTTGRKCGMTTVWGKGLLS